ncbi:hypothetical protein B0T18DRAFT_254969 [Schizothecium vesticola]|uniref:Uncharacterized protein n=1 Tax=Schizothecium vesticola TaxID=314040 RepID=A0AA40BR58_9PEZI|nr:hypothetical protein B0T18DRAFT_254969 [Schizothecium vesticola]
MCLQLCSTARTPSLTQAHSRRRKSPSHEKLQVFVARAVLVLGSGSPWGPRPDLECGVSGVSPPAAPSPPHICSPCRVQGCSGCRWPPHTGPQPSVPSRDWRMAGVEARLTDGRAAPRTPPPATASLLKAESIDGSGQRRLGRRTAPAVGNAKAAGWRLVVCSSSAGTDQVAGDPTLDICAQVQQDAPEAIESRHGPLGPCHEVGVPLENALGQLSRERACGQKERGHREVGASTEIFCRELGRAIVVIRQEYPPRHEGCGGGSLKLHTSFSQQFGWGGVLIEDMAMARRGRSSKLVRSLRTEAEDICHHHCQSLLVVS